MVRKLSLAVILLLIAPLFSAHGEPSALPMPPGRAADSYAIYALLLPGEPFKSLPPEQAKQWEERFRDYTYEIRRLTAKYKMPD